MLMRIVLGRLSAAIPTLVLVSILSFLIIHLVPGDPVYGFAGTVGAPTPDQMHQLRVRLGLLDPPSMVPYSNIGREPEDPWLTEKHKAVARVATKESIVLLKNSNRFIDCSAGISTYSRAVP